MLSNLWSSSNEGTQSGKTDTTEVSLTSILPTAALRTDLALLVALSTDAMRRDLTAPFDAPKSSGPSDSSRSPIPPAEEDSLIDTESSDEPSAAAAAAAARAADRGRRQYQRELSSPQMQGLRRAALAFFDRWQVGVLRRVGEVLGVRSDAVRLARRQHAAAIAALAKEKRSKQYLEWANGGGEENEDEVSAQGSPFIPTRLSELEETKRVLILHCLLLLLLSLEDYTAHSRVLLLHITRSLLLPRSILTEHESSVAQGLLAAASSMSADETTARAAASDATSRKWKVGLATVAGAALIGVTGGLAAPILAAGVGTVMGGLGLGATALSGLLGSLAGSSILIGGLFGAYGGKMTGRVMEKYAKEVEDFKFIPLNPSSDDSITSTHKLRVAIAITGWLTTDSEITTPWRVLSPASIEPFALRWELSALLRLGTSLSSVLKSFAWDTARHEIIKRTLLSTLYAGLWPLGLVKMATLIDNPFLVAKSRADSAGKVLADALIDHCQGKRPVTLIGYSLGARVIYACLLSLAERGAFGMVEDVVVMGAPVSGEAVDWARIRAVVAGRVVNVYSGEDYILGFLYRGSSVRLGVAGLRPVIGVEGVENVDASDLVKGHLKYRFAVGQILDMVGCGDLNAREVARERDVLVRMEREEEEKDLAQEKQNEGKDDSKANHESELSTTTAYQDDSLAKETEKLKLAPKAPAEPPQAQKHDEADSDDESEDGRIQMQDLDPTPEPEPEDENVRFGSSDRGFDIAWSRP